MIAYRIDDMTCGGCVRAIRAAVARVAPAASVQADVAARALSVDGAPDAAAIDAAIADAGFHAQRVAATAAAQAQTKAGCGGAGCGCGASTPR